MRHLFTTTRLLGACLCLAFLASCQPAPEPPAPPANIRVTGNVKGLKRSRTIDLTWVKQGDEYQAADARLTLEQVLKIRETAVGSRQEKNAPVAFSNRDVAETETRIRALYSWIRIVPLKMVSAQEMSEAIKKMSTAWEGKEENPSAKATIDLGGSPSLRIEMIDSSSGGWLFLGSLSPYPKWTLHLGDDSWESCSPTLGEALMPLFAKEGPGSLQSYKDYPEAFKEAFALERGREWAIQALTKGLELRKSDKKIRLESITDVRAVPTMNILMVEAAVTGSKWITSVTMTGEPETSPEPALRNLEESLSDADTAVSHHTWLIKFVQTNPGLTLLPLTEQDKIDWGNQKMKGWPKYRVVLQDGSVSIILPENGSALVPMSPELKAVLKFKGAVPEKGRYLSVAPDGQATPL